MERLSEDTAAAGEAERRMRELLAESLSAEADAAALQELAQLEEAEDAGEAARLPAVPAEPTVRIWWQTAFLGGSSVWTCSRTVALSVRKLQWVAKEAASLKRCTGVYGHVSRTACLAILECDNVTGMVSIATTGLGSNMLWTSGAT